MLTKPPHITLYGLALAGTLAFAGAVAAASGGHVTRQEHGSVLPIPDHDGGATSLPLPARGTSKKRVAARYGEPAKRHAAVGDPPISRWDYPDFSVFFEYNLVIHAVVPGHLPPLHHRAALANGN